MSNSRLLQRVAALVLGTALAACSAEPEPTGPVNRFSHVLPEGRQFTVEGSPLVALSRDGSRMVYVADRRIYLMAMDTRVSSPIPGSDVDPSDPFFSPDGAWIAYWSGADSQLKKIPSSGGAALTLTDTASDPLGRSFWSADGTIIWGQTERVMQVSADGGTPGVLAEVPGAGLVYGPRVLPDGKSLLFHTGGPTAGEVVVQSLESGERKALFPGLFPRYLPTGHILYGLDDALFAVPFDLTTLEAVGQPVSLIEGVRTRPLQYALSDSGVFAWVPGSEQTESPGPARGQINIVLNWFEELSERVPAP